MFKFYSSMFLFSECGINQYEMAEFIFLDFSGVKKKRLVLSLSSIVCLNGKIVLYRKREDEKEEE